MNIQSRRYEYAVVKLLSDSSPRKQEEQLDQLGAQGWQLVAVTHSTSDGFTQYIFMRELKKEAKWNG